MDAGNPYLTPLLDPSMHSGGTMDASQNCYAAETQGSSPSSALPSKDTAETAFGNALSDMSIADAIKCITGFLKTDSRSAVLYASSVLSYHDLLSAPCTIMLGATFLSMSGKAFAQSAMHLVC